MIYHQLNEDGTVSKNEYDNFIRGKAHSQVYRYSYPVSDDLSKNILCLYLPSGKSTSNIVIPKLQELGVDIQLVLNFDTEEIWQFTEDQIHKVNEIMSFKTKGKNQQLKEKIREDKQKAKEEKLRIKEEKLLAKQNKQTENN